MRFGLYCTCMSMVRLIMLLRGPFSLLNADTIHPAVVRCYLQEAQRFFVLTQTDNLWKEHLQAIKFLQQAVGLRGYAQRDPLAEYKLEGYGLFLEMMATDPAQRHLQLLCLCP